MRETVGKSFHGSRNGFLVLSEAAVMGRWCALRRCILAVCLVHDVACECRFVPVLFKNREVGAWSGKSQSGGQNIILCSPWDGPSWHDQRTGGGGQKHLMSAVVRRGVGGWG